MEELEFDLDDGSSPTDMATPQEARNHSIQRCIQSLAHACECRDPNCRLPSCQKMKRVVRHTKTCKRKTHDGCPICKQLIALCCYHGKHCQETKCSVPFCSHIKYKLEQQQLQQRLQQVHLAPSSDLSNVSLVPALTNIPGNAGSSASMSPSSIVSSDPLMSGMGSPHTLL